MASVQFTDVQARPAEFLDVTSLTLDEFQQLVPPFEVAFQAHMAAWRLDGQPRTARQFTMDKNCPLPTPEDRLLFLLTSLKTYAFQVVHGCLFGMVQSKAHQWIHVLLPALRTLGDAPTRSLTALAQRLGVSEAEAATVVVPLAEAPASVVAGPTAALASPLWPMTAPHGVSSAPKTLLHRPHVGAASTRTTPSKMSCWCMRCSRSSFAVQPVEAASMIRAWPRPRPLPDLLGAGCCRIWASWPSHFPRWTS